MRSFFASLSAGALRKAILITGVMSLGLGTFAPITHGDAPPAAEAGATLTIEQIGNALDPYNKNTTSINGHTEYSLTVKRGKWNVNVIVSLSPNGKVIWMTNNLTAVPDVSKASPAALMNVLAKNSEIGPMFFSIAGNSLRISSPVPNYDMTPAKVAGSVDGLVATVAATEDLWSGDALTGAARPAKPLAK
jgi:hypothetical protein